jgi:hypothetical protein
MTQYSGTTQYSGASSEDPSKAEAARGAASDVAGSAQEAASGVAHTAVDQTKDVLAQAQGQARDLVSEGRGQLMEQARTTQQTAASNLASLADELRQMAEGSTQGGTATEAVRQISDRAHSLAGWLADREPGEALDEARRFARQRPGVFLLGAALAGLAAGRLTRGVVAAAHDSSQSGPSQVTGSDSAPFTERSQTEIQDYPSAQPVAAYGTTAAFGETAGAPGGLGQTATQVDPIGEWGAAPQNVEVSRP